MNDATTDPLDPALATLKTRPLFVMRLQVAPIVVVGAGPAGTRRVGAITGGRFDGERLSGSVLDGGSDWQHVRSDGATTLDVRVLLRTTQGDLISMTYQGLRHGPADVMARIDRGEIVDPASYYFRTNPMFETASATYGWLNRILAIGIGQRRADGPIYSVFEIL